jgi:hypothetical protein
MTSYSLVDRVFLDISEERITILRTEIAETSKSNYQTTWRRMLEVSIDVRASGPGLLP